VKKEEKNIELIWVKNFDKAQLTQRRLIASPIPDN